MLDSLCEGDVLSGSSASGVHHPGVLEGWFGQHWWTGRFFVLLVTTLAIFAPLASFKRIGQSSSLIGRNLFGHIIHLYLMSSCQYFA